jgi:hypothetical protein
MNCQTEGNSARADEVTDAINRAIDAIGDQSDDFVAAAARAVLEKTEW